jgi:phosphotransferase system enzyme I (PtsP)
MITNLGEIRTCRELVAEAMTNLSREGLDFVDTIPLGAMIEVPAAVYLAPHLAAEVDFFSVGTNDLIQYLLAADRSNPLVESYYDPLHPAVLQALAYLSQVAREKEIDLCLCGEMATDPANLLILIGLGIHQFSLSAPFIPKLKELLGQIPLSLARDTAQRVLQQSDSAGTREILNEVLANLPC